MVSIKNMDMPRECWKCELVHDNTSGLTICNLTGEALYPMGTMDKRPDECPLVGLEVEEMGNYYPKFEKGNTDTLILDHSFYSDCLEYANTHNLNVLYTNTTCTGSIETIMAFKKRGYSHELYEVPQIVPGGLKLNDVIYCRFTR